MAVISMDVGKVLDVEVMSPSCKGCKLHEKEEKENPEAYNEWKANHYCWLNHTGSANSMESEGAKRIWGRSIEKNKFRYSKLFSDGDSKSHLAVQDTYSSDSIVVEKYEWVGHVQKRVGCHLRSLKKKKKGLGGPGKLTDAAIARLQNYYGIAIRQNKKI